MKKIMLCVGPLVPHTWFPNRSLGYRGFALPSPSPCAHILLEFLLLRDRNLVPQSLVAFVPSPTFGWFWNTWKEWWVSFYSFCSFRHTLDALKIPPRSNNKTVEIIIRGHESWIESIIFPPLYVVPDAGPHFILPAPDLFINRSPIHQNYNVE